VIAVVLFAAMEVPRWATEEAREESLSGWLCGVEADALPFLPWLLLAPLMWVGLGARRRGPATSLVVRWLNRNTREPAFDLGAWLAAILIGITGFAVSYKLNTRVATLPPAYHDEYSYLFQAETYAAGRLWFPSFEPRPELFDQMHVLNKGRFARRYFPGNGMWIVPFLIAGKLHLSGAAAMEMVCFCIFWTGRDLSSNAVGLIAGVHRTSGWALPAVAWRSQCSVAR
jgi:hypothetical protein